MIGEGARSHRAVSVIRSMAAPALVLVLIVTPFVLFGDRLEGWTRAALAGGHPLGAAGALLAVALLAGDVLLPVPSSLVSIACGLAFGPWAGAALSALGMTLGSALGYGLGRWAGAGGARRRIGMELGPIERLYERHGEWMIALLRPVPVLAEASAIFAGLTRVPWRRFLALSLVANAVVSTGYASAGALLGRLPWAGLLALLLLLGVTAASWRVVRSPARSSNGRTKGEAA